MCGVFGIRSPERDVARLAYFGLFALQHRGQESAGIAVSDQGRLTALRDLGLVSQVFDEQKLRGLRGEIAIGHTRYSTTGSSQWSNAQPLVQHGRVRTVALGHNGNLTNATELREELHERGIPLRSTSDSEVIAALIANDEAPLERAAVNAMARLEGAYSIVALSEGRLLGFRDPHGFRPLALGRLGDDWVLASETCALDLVGAAFERDVGRGELVVVDAQGCTVAQMGPGRNTARCIERSHTDVATQSCDITQTGSFTKPSLTPAILARGLVASGSLSTLAETSPEVLARFLADVWPDLERAPKVVVGEDEKTKGA